jgi:hypothetical protein
MSALPSRKKQIMAEHVVSADEVVRRFGVTVEDASAWACSKRKRDELFGVWSQMDQSFVYPDFQFGGKATPAQVKELLIALRTRVGFDPINADKGGWARAYWLYQPDPLLSRRALAATDQDVADPVAPVAALSTISDAPRTPAEVFLEHPEVIIALVKELSPHPHTCAPIGRAPDLLP